MRSLALLALSAGLLVGCTSSRDYRDRAYPASARVEGSGQDRYVVCHKGKKTQTLPRSAVRAHLDHGDRFGSCDRRDRDDRGRGGQRRGKRKNR